MIARIVKNALAAVLATVLASALLWAEAGEVIGRTLTPLDGRQARKAECTLGDLVADAMQAAVKLKTPQGLVKADLALIQAARLREQVIPKGDLTEEDLRAVLLYPDEHVLLVEITGEKLQAALERSLSTLPQPNTGFLQVSGPQVQFRSQSQPNHRVESITVSGKPLEAEKTYLAAVPESLAKGALGYSRIFDGLKVKETGPELLRAVCDYVRKTEVVNLTAGERLQDLSPPPPSK